MASESPWVHRIDLRLSHMADLILRPGVGNRTGNYC